MAHGCETLGWSRDNGQDISQDSQQHQADAHRTKVINCRTCEKTFLSQTALDQHEHNSHPTTYDCIECDRRLLSENALNEHERDSHAKTHDCNRCNKPFSSTLALEQHECHSHPMVYNCECDRSFPTEQALQQHGRISRHDRHVAEPQHERKHERESHDPKVDFEEVVRLFERTFPDRQVIYDSGHCDRSFSTEEALQQHEHGPPAHEDTFGHEHPDRLFSPEHALQKHELDLLAHEATLGCKYCDGSFSTQTALFQHRCGLPTHEDTPDLEPSHQKTPSEDNSPATSFAFDRSFFDKDFSDRDDLRQPTPWSLQPAKHEEVLELIQPVLSVEFFEASGFDDCTRHHDTHIMGYFTCSNKACRKGTWSSKMIALTIRLYSGKRYNAVVWHQRCKKCKSFGEPELEGSYAERIAYRLKVWFGKPHELIDYHPGDPFPHKRHLCEGCKNGHCPIDALDKT